MKILVCGGRNFRSPAQVFKALDDLHAKMPITELMQGGATGVDQFAKEWATTKPEIKRFRTCVIVGTGPFGRRYSHG